MTYRPKPSAVQRPCKKTAALENIYQEMNVAGWYITHHNAALGTNTRLTCFALIGCTLFNWVSCIADRRRQLSCVGEGFCSDATQLNSTGRWVELSCVAIDTLTGSRRSELIGDSCSRCRVELCRYKRAFTWTINLYSIVWL